jgi:uncharacterized protein (DUF885 family)
VKPVHLLALLAAACSASSPKPASPPKAASGAAAGVADARLADLLERHWEHHLSSNPVFATRSGDRRFDDRIRDVSAAAIDAERAALRGFLDEARRLPATAFSPGDRESLALFVEQLEAEAATEVCAFETWSVPNPLQGFASLPEVHVIASRRDADNLLARYRAIPRHVDDTIANLERGAAAGRFASAARIGKTIEMYQAELARPTSAWRLVAGVEPRGWSPADIETLRAEVEALVHAEVRPAYQRYHGFLSERLLPGARPDDRPGLASLDVGVPCYAAQIRLHTTLPRSAEELHRLGEAEIARINADMVTLGERLFGTRDLGEILRRLRSDPAMTFASEEEVEAKAQASLEAARAKIPEWFGTLPRAECVVRRIPEYEAPYTTVAYYREPNADGSKPGEYFINVWQPRTRTRYEAEALAFHESIPGHHLQLARSQELPAVPAFRRHSDATAFIEGWALYTERLADEMGLYSGDLDRLGMLSYDAWRASRLVVDTGLHAFGWSRERAVAYMLAHTALAENNVRNEVDRYIGWPGQALAYKVGQLTIRELRAEAEARLGEHFDVRAFHDVVLGGGGVTMDVLRQRVQAWVRASRRGG